MIRVQKCYAVEIGVTCPLSLLVAIIWGAHWETHLNEATPQTCCVREPCVCVAPNGRTCRRKNPYYVFIVSGACTLKFHALILFISFHLSFWVFMWACPFFYRSRFIAKCISCLMAFLDFEIKSIPSSHLGKHQRKGCNIAGCYS